MAYVIGIEITARLEETGLEIMCISADRFVIELFRILPHYFRFVWFWFFVPVHTFLFRLERKTFFGLSCQGS